MRYTSSFAYKFLLFLAIVAGACLAFLLLIDGDTVGAQTNNPPVFDDPAQTTATIPEDAKAGTLIATYNATDADGSDILEGIHYLLRGDAYGLRNFEIMTETSDGQIMGTLMVKSGANLDVDAPGTVSSHIVEVNVCDADYACSELAVDITVTNVNDEPPALEFSAAQLETLFNEIISKTEQREAFSESKQSNTGFSAIEDMKKLRSEFVASKTETELYYALVKLSNARRDRHLQVYPVDGVLQPPLQECVSAPIHVLPDLSDIQNPAFFVAAVDEGLNSPQVGDLIVGVNERSIEEYIEEFTHWVRHSTLRGLYWRMAEALPEREDNAPPSLYSERLNLTVENQSGQRYEVSLPYSTRCSTYGPRSAYPGFVEVMSRESFKVLIDRNRRIILLQWLDFEYSLIQDIVDLMEYAEREQILDYDTIIDVTLSSGGSRGAYAIQRLVGRPFRPTFGNVRLSDLGKGLVEYYASLEPDPNAPDIFGLNLSRSWLIDWAHTDAMDAIRRGDEYTPNVPFKLAHLPKDSDGILQPAPVHFSGKVVIINGRSRGGSHLDQFLAMFVDNELAQFVGVPTGGYSNTWEGHEVLEFADTGQPVVEFMWSIGHTIRPNGEVLEGNPAQPDTLIPLTRHNFEEYYQTLLLDTAMAVLDEPEPRADSCVEIITADTPMPIDGSWASDCASENRSGSYARYYTFTLTEQLEVAITLESDMDTYLYLLEGVGKDGDVMHENNDHAGESACAVNSGRSTDSCIAASLEAGDYRIEATTYDAGATGDFTLTVTGLDGEPVEPPSPSGSYTSLVIGELHTCGLQSDGAVACWGNDDYGQVSDVPVSTFTFIAAGPHHTCGIRTDDTVACWGRNDYGQVSATPVSDRFVTLIVGRYHNCGIRTDGSVACWGRNDYGQAASQ